MANLSYIRFENTYRDLQDCYNNLDDENISKTEARYRERLVNLCKDIIEWSNKSELESEDREVPNAG